MLYPSDSFWAAQIRVMSTMTLGQHKSATIHGTLSKVLYLLNPQFLPL
jgi:hypothetical protein